MMPRFPAFRGKVACSLLILRPGKRRFHTYNQGHRAGNPFSRPDLFCIPDGMAAIELLPEKPPAIKKKTTIDRKTFAVQLWQAQSEGCATAISADSPCS
jgi:hypothetical protein